jgi:glycosyltransferase involved in cell wall biosynthesis
MPRRVTVAFDAEVFWAQRRGGVSRYFVELAREFAEHPELGVDVRLPVRRTINEHLHEWDPTDHPLIELVPDTVTLRPIANRLMRAVGRRVPRHWSTADVIHHTHFAPEVIAGTPGAVRVITVHDMIPERLPQLPEAHIFSVRKLNAVRAATAIICVSQATKDDLLHFWGQQIQVPVHVVHHGVASHFRPEGQQLQLSGPYVLYVGTRRGYKDFGLLLRACAALGRRWQGIRILCVGGGAFTSEESRRIASLGLDSLIDQRDLPDSELPSVYRGALAYVCTSRLEGFGLPVLEALACGCPAVVADTPALREVGGEAVRTFPPGDDEALGHQLAEILRADEAQAAMRSQVGIERAAQFTWLAAARATAAVYVQALGDRP